MRGLVRDEKADVFLWRVGKQASKQLVAQGLGITEGGWPQIGQRGRERPDAIVDDLFAGSTRPSVKRITSSGSEQGQADPMPSGRSGGVLGVLTRPSP